MTPAQAAWWRQAQSDLQIYELLRREQTAACHQLHYVQMAAEKIAKAYILRNGKPPRKSHAAFQLFLRALASQGKGETARLAGVFEFNTPGGFTTFLQYSGPLAEELEKLAPDLAGDGPNPEYPWPHASPATAPVEFAFPLWKKFETEPNGRRLLTFLRRAIRHFPAYA